MVAEQLAPLPALVSVAEATQNVRLGTFVVNNDLRHPLLLVQEAATVDLLTAEEANASCNSQRNTQTSSACSFIPFPTDQYVTVFAKYMQEFAPVIERLRGS